MTTINAWVDDGVHYTVRTPYVKCEKCGGQRRLGSGPHAPHVVEEGGLIMKVDCKNDLIEVLDAK